MKLKAVVAVTVLGLYPSLSSTQTSLSLSDFRNLSVQTDIEIASLICPRWSPMSRIEFVNSLFILGLVSREDVLDLSDTGMIRFKDPTSNEIQDAEMRSFAKAEELGLETFCIQTSMWLTVPAVRQALETSGVFRAGEE